MKAQSKSTIFFEDSIKNRTKISESSHKRVEEKKSNRLANLFKDDSMNKKSLQKNVNNSELLSMRSTPNLLQTNNYIKIAPESSKLYESMLLQYKESEPQSSKINSKKFITTQRDFAKVM